MTTLACCTLRTITRIKQLQASSARRRVFADEKTLVSSSRDDTIKLWDVATGELKRTLKEGAGAFDMYALAFSHDGSMMASANVDGSIILWDAKTFEPIRTLTGHTKAVREVEFSPDGKTLASGAEDNTFRLWDVATGNAKATRNEHTAAVKAVVFYPDGNTIATASSDGTLRLWDASGEPKKVLKGGSSGWEFCRLSPDAKQLFSGTGNEGQLIFWDAQSGEILKDITDAHGTEPGVKEIDSGTYTPDGKFAISGSKDRSIKFWNPQTYELVYTISGNPGRIESMTISRDGKTLVTGFGGGNNTIKIWDLSGLK